MRVGNVIGVYFAWWKYGDRISRRFYVTSAGAGRRNIEELRTRYDLIEFIAYTKTNNIQFVCH